MPGISLFFKPWNTELKVGYLSHQSHNLSVKQPLTWITNHSTFKYAYVCWQRINAKIRSYFRKGLLILKFSTFQFSIEFLLKELYGKVEGGDIYSDPHLKIMKQKKKILKMGPKKFVNKELAANNFLKFWRP